jgi:hypothetical protein
MVKKIEKYDKIAYVCEACGYGYGKRELAEKCETWCVAHHSCNLEIIAHGTPPENI